MANRTQIQKKGSSNFTPPAATGMFKPRPFAEPAQPEAATPEVQTKVELGNIGGDRLAGMQVSAPAPIQAKLTIGAPGDKYEQEADTIARKVVRQISAPKPPDANPNGDDGFVQRQFSAPSIGRLVVQRQEAIEGGEASANLESSISQAKSSGVPLAAPIRRQMEGAFGADFSGVRIHANNTADTLNRDLSSRAFTTGNNIFFKRGEYDPGSSGGKELLAHELTHVVQQGGSVALKRVQRDGEEAEDIDPSKVASGNTAIDRDDIVLEKIAHDFVYQNTSIGDIADEHQANDKDNDKKKQTKKLAREHAMKTAPYLQKHGFQPFWYPDGKVKEGAMGINYGVLIPNRKGKEELDRVPVVAFRGTSDLDTTYRDLDFDSPGSAAFHSFLEREFAIIVDLLKTFGYNKVDVTGHSLGGALAQHFTGRFPANVRRLVTFQSAAPNAAQYQEAVDSVGENRPTIVHHVAAGDVVDLAGGSHLRGTVYVHRIKGKNWWQSLKKGYTPLAHTQMLLNSSDIVGEEESKNEQGEVADKHAGNIKVYKDATRVYDDKSRIIEAGRIGAIPGGKLAVGGGMLIGSGVDNWKRGKFTDITNWNNTKGVAKMAAGGVSALGGGLLALGGGLGGAAVGATVAGGKKLWNKVSGWFG
jgi:Domain of unknown function (DUF4157)/Lipase (class 3)